MSKVIVVGGGPAGVMAALSASKNNEVILIERNSEIGKKLRLTGGGRCNITNNRNIDDFFDKVIAGNNRYMRICAEVFSEEAMIRMLDYFSEKGIG